MTLARQMLDLIHLHKHHILPDGNQCINLERHLLQILHQSLPQLELQKALPIKEVFGWASVFDESRHV